MDAFDESFRSEAEDKSLKVYSFADVIQAGAEKKVEYTEPAKDDVYIFSYTSGTTGDSKGVKLTH